MTGTHSGDSASSDWRNRAEDRPTAFRSPRSALETFGFATSGDEDRSAESRMLTVTRGRSMS